MAGVARYKVVALSLGGLRKKVFESGDIVTQDQLSRPVAELVAGKFIDPIAEAPKSAPAPVVAPAKVEEKPEGVSGASESAPAAPKAEPTEEPTVPPYNSVTKAEIIELLGDKPHNPKDSKKKLYALLG